MAFASLAQSAAFKELGVASLADAGTIKEFSFTALAQNALLLEKAFASLAQTGGIKSIDITTLAFSGSIVVPFYTTTLNIDPLLWKLRRERRIRLL